MQKRYRVFRPLTSTLSRRQMTPKYMHPDLIAYTYQLLDISFFSFLLQYKSFLSSSGLLLHNKVCYFFTLFGISGYDQN
jgi:hypothetical protein